MTDKEVGALSFELRYRRGLHAYLGLLAAGVDSAPTMECLALIMVNWDGEVQVLHPFFSVPVAPYGTDRCLLDFRGELPSEGLPQIAAIPVASFVVQHAVNSVPREYHMVHVEGILPLD